MTQDDVLRDGAGRRINWDQFETWVVAQAIRNKLEMFHGGGASDPEDPDWDEGFITDKQMRAVNIVIRYTVHEALREMRTAVQLIRASRRRELAPAEVEEMEKAVKYSLWQLSTVHDYWSLPAAGSWQQRTGYGQVRRNYAVK